MIRTIKIELNAAFPQMPLLPFQVFHDSAASVTVLNVPRRIVSLALKIKNVSGVDQSFSAQRSGSSWCVVIPASFFEQSGTSTKGVKVIGVDEQANRFTLGAADLVVMLDDGTVTPVSPTGEGDMKHSEFSDLEAPDGMTQKESNTLLQNIVRKLKGSALLLLSACCLPALGAITPDTDHGDISPTAKVSQVVHAAVDGSARQLPKYLHIYNADDSYPEDAQEYYRSRGDGKADGGCSAVRDGGFLYRNFDFPFDDRAEFVVRMSAGPNRFASVGVAQVGTNLTEQMVTSGKPDFSARYKWLPGATVDGINENGVVAEINVVDGEPPASTGGDIHPLAAVRWALDRGTSAEMVATNLAARIAFPSGWEQNFHWMIADERETWIVENGTASNVTAVAAKRVMTNFPIIPDTYEGMGKERYELLYGGANITNAWWTNAYLRETNPPWLSEFDNNYEYMNAALNAWDNGKGKESHRSETYTQTTYPFKTYTWWQTVHTSIYDITNRVLRVSVQESTDFYTFQVPSAGGVKVETDPTVPAWAKAAQNPSYTKADIDAKLEEKVPWGDIPGGLSLGGKWIDAGPLSIIGSDSSIGSNLSVGDNALLGSSGGSTFIGGWLQFSQSRDYNSPAFYVGQGGHIVYTENFGFTNLMFPSLGGTIARIEDIPTISSTDPTFSNAVKTVMQIEDRAQNLSYTITADDKRFYFTPTGAINPED